MAFDQLNEYGIGDSNLTTMMETLDGSYIGKAEITLSNYDTDAAPVVKVGSIFDNNGSLYRVISSDETPTGYSGISVSTTFYLYFDASATAFIYSSTAPTWNDALQGWYNDNDRALFSMHKDSTGTLYENKEYIKSLNIELPSSFNSRETVSTTITTTTTYTLPRGFYDLTASLTSPLSSESARIQRYVNGGWREITRTEAVSTSGTIYTAPINSVISDGTNVRFSFTISDPGTTGHYYINHYAE
jgi:hypothetical protein